jgi:hypothetical protein
MWRASSKSRAVGGSIDTTRSPRKSLRDLYSLCRKLQKITIIIIMLACLGDVPYSGPNMYSASYLGNNVWRRRQTLQASIREIKISNIVLPHSRKKHQSETSLWWQWQQHQAKIVTSNDSLQHKRRAWKTLVLQRNPGIRWLCLWETNCLRASWLRRCWTTFPWIHCWIVMSESDI